MQQDSRSFRLRAISCEQRAKAVEKDAAAKQEWTALAIEWHSLANAVETTTEKDDLDFA